MCNPGECAPEEARRQTYDYEFGKEFHNREEMSMSNGEMKMNRNWEDECSGQNDDMRWDKETPLFTLDPNFPWITSDLYHKRAKTSPLGIKPPPFLHSCFVGKGNTILLPTLKQILEFAPDCWPLPRGLVLTYQCPMWWTQSATGLGRSTLS